MKLNPIIKYAVLAVTALPVLACTVSDTKAPPLQGPSEMALSLTMTANPDAISWDGASQTQIVIEARDANGQLRPNTAMRAQIVVSGQVVDYGFLSARTLVTASNGRATLMYTAPPAPVGSSNTPDLVTIQVIPSGTDASDAIGRSVVVRLVPTGVIIGGGPTPQFTFTPANPAAFTDVFFDASTSIPALGTSITSFAWTFGDGSTGSGITPIHRFAAGTWTVTLTVTDSNGLAASSSKAVTVAIGAVPTADFTFSPSTPDVNQEILFNGGLSRAGPGHTIVRYDWNFGSGAPRSGVTQSKSYDTADTYSVTLTVTDEVGQTAQSTKSVTVGGGLIADFTMSPTNPTSGTQVNYNGSSSTAAAGTTIVLYSWDFGDGDTASGPSPTATNTYPVSATSVTYTVRLTVTDSTGRTATTTKTLTVAP